MEDLLTVQPPDAENRTSGGVGGCRGAIPGTRPDHNENCWLVEGIISIPNVDTGLLALATNLAGGYFTDPTKRLDQFAEQGTATAANDLRRLFTLPESTVVAAISTNTHFAFWVRRSDRYYAAPPHQLSGRGADHQPGGLQYRGDFSRRRQRFRRQRPAQQQFSLWSADFSPLQLSTASSAGNSPKAFRVPDHEAG